MKLSLKIPQTPKKKREREGRRGRRRWEKKEERKKRRESEGKARNTGLYPSSPARDSYARGEISAITNGKMTNCPKWPPFTQRPLPGQMRSALRCVDACHNFKACFEKGFSIGSL